MIFAFASKIKMSFKCMQKIFTVKQFPKMYSRFFPKMCYSSANGTLMKHGQKGITNEDEILQYLNDLPIDVLKDFTNIGINRAKRLDSYRKLNNGLLSIKELENIDGFSTSIIKSIQQNGLVKKKGRGYLSILDDAEAKQIMSLTTITIGSHEIYWCMVTRELNVTHWQSEALKRDKSYSPKDFVCKVEKVLDRIPESDIRVIESMTHKGSSRDPFVFPYVLHNRLTEVVIHSISKVKTVSLDPNIIRKHFDLSKGFNKQYYAVPLVNDILAEGIKRKKKISAEEIQQNIDMMNSLPGCKHTVDSLVDHNAERQTILQKHKNLNRLTIPGDLVDFYKNNQTKEGLSSSLLLALTFIETEILDREI